MIDVTFLYYCTEEENQEELRGGCLNNKEIKLSYTTSMHQLKDKLYKYNYGQRWVQYYFFRCNFDLGTFLPDLV